MRRTLRKLLTPLRTIVFSFTLLILTGTFLLYLPAATQTGTRIGFLTALFTATSASCVTGLVLVDTATTWSRFGQLVILSLIQIGGLGIITLAVFFFTLLGKKMRIKEALLVQESVNHFDFADVAATMKKIFRMIFLVELGGALLLAIRFIPRYGPHGVFMSVFHAVSAFCNAGFDIMGDVEAPFASLTGYVGDPLVTLTISGLVIFGGLGYLFWQDALGLRKGGRLGYHARFVLIMTGSLLLFGTVFFLVSEFNNPATLSALSAGEKLNAAFFQSVTPRTAGFNTLDQGSLTPISKLITIILMFIGGGSGSTAGGVKITTIGVAVVAILSQIRGKGEATAFRHRIHNTIVLKAISIIALSLMLVLGITILVLAAEQAAGKHPPLVDILFEVGSAFGTVGLSSVATPTLTPLSHVFLLITMFLGKVGPLSFVLTLTQRGSRDSAQVVLPEGKLVVG